MEVINDMEKLHQEDNLVGDVIGQMLHESMDEVGELNVGKHSVDRDEYQGDRNNEHLEK